MLLTHAPSVTSCSPPSKGLRLDRHPIRVRHPSCWHGTQSPRPQSSSITLSVTTKISRRPQRIPILDYQDCPTLGHPAAIARNLGSEMRIGTSENPGICLSSGTPGLRAPGPARWRRRLMTQTNLTDRLVARPGESLAVNHIRTRPTLPTSQNQLQTLTLEGSMTAAGGNCGRFGDLAARPTLEIRTVSAEERGSGSIWELDDVWG